MKIYQNCKAFVKDHSDVIVMGAVYTALGAAVTSVAVYAAKQAEELEDWTREQNFAGKTVYELADGSHIAVSKDQIS
jgi:hypothetical protein